MSKLNIFAFLTLTALLLDFAVAAQRCRSTIDFVIGSYTGQPWIPSANGSGITFASFSRRELRATAVLTASTAGENPSYVARAGSYLYAVNENAEGALAQIRFGRRFPYVSTVTRPSTAGGTTHVAVLHRFKAGGAVLAVANYDGSISTFVRNRKPASFRRTDVYTVPARLASKLRDASLTQQQAAPHPHMVLPLPMRTTPRRHVVHVVVPDLGSDSVFLFAVTKSTGKIRRLARVQMPLGSGPRHAAKHPASNTVFVVNEIALSVSVLRPGCAAQPLIGLCDTVNFFAKPDMVPGASAAAVRVSADGKFLYASVRNPGTLLGQIVAYELNAKGDVGRQIGVYSSHGVHPRDFYIVEKVRVGNSCKSFVAVVNRDTNNMVLVERNPMTGALAPTAAFSMKVDTPVSVLV